MIEDYTKVVLEGTEEQIEEALEEYRREGIEYQEVG